MKKENIFISPELVFIDDEIYQAFHGLTGIDRVQQYTLVSGNRRKGSEYTDRRDATGGRDVIGIYRDITLRRSLLEAEMPAGLANQAVYLLFLNEPGRLYADAKNRNSDVRQVKPYDQASLRTPACRGMDESVDPQPLLPELTHDLKGAIHIAECNNNYIEDYPGFEKGFGYLRDTAADMHVVARERLPDLTTVLARYPDVLGISADEGTAWVIHGDVGRIIGRDKAFVYAANGPTDKGLPYLTLYPGDSYNLYTRRVVGRAADESPVKKEFIAALFKKYSAPRLGGATVLVAQDGKVFVDRAFGIPPQDRYMPRTTLPQFPIGDIKKVFSSLCAQLPAHEAPPRGVMRPAYYSSPLERCVSRLSIPVGMHRTTVPPGSAEILSDVDELYRLELGLEYSATWPKADYSKGWTADTFDGVQRLAAYATLDGGRAALVRIPSRHATVIILANDPNADARAMSEAILNKLLRSSR